jgi:hypothetical protein
MAGAAAAAAFEADPVRYNMISLAEPGGRTLFFFEVRNVSSAAWAPGSVTLTNVKNPMGGPAQLGVSRSVLPNETAYWDFEGTAPSLPGIHESVWDIRRGGTVISPRLTCYVVAVPKEAQELRAKIQKLIDEFNREHGHEVEQVVRMVRDLIEREGGGLIQRLIETRCGLLPGMLAALGIALAARRFPRLGCTLCC